MIKPRLAAALAASALLVAGCGSDDSSSSSTTTDDAGNTRTVERTKVQVVEGLGAKGGIDPAAIYRRLSNGVVTVVSLFGNNEELKTLQGGGTAGQGSGFVLDDKGYIATNAHVVTDGTGKDIKAAKEVYVQFADGNQVRAKVVGFDPNSDVALLKVDPKDLELVPLKLGNTADAQVGEPVVAIGSPFGEEQSLSVGVISATKRNIKALTDFSISDALQTDAAINHGNSGGPLLDAKGQVIGINSQIESSSGGGEGVGFAVSVDTIEQSLAQLRKNGKANYGYVGLSTQSLYPQLANKLKLPVKQGALVADVVSDGPADKAGIKGGGKEQRFQASLVKPGGDVIVAVNGKKVTRDDDFTSQISRFRPGQTVTLELYRDDKKRDVKVKLGERPTEVPDN